VVPEVLKTEVDQLRARGIAVSIHELNQQCFVRVLGLEAPSPPWGAAAHDLVIAIPAAYPKAQLDAFYLAHPYVFREGTHPRVNGDKISLGERTWQLVSWHYPEARAWIPGQDCLETHITHCRGFFLQRGAINAM
jgi:hypothetical protein